MNVEETREHLVKVSCIMWLKELDKRVKNERKHQKKVVKSSGRAWCSFSAPWQVTPLLTSSDCEGHFDTHQTIQWLLMHCMETVSTDLFLFGLNLSPCIFWLFVSDLWCGNWGQVSDNRKLILQPSEGMKVLLIIQTRHHGQTHTYMHADTLSDRS